MAIYRIFPSQDTTIYSQAPTQNTGRDELLEIGGYPINGVGNTARTLISFKTSEISDVLTNKAGISPIVQGAAFSASLKLSLCEAQELPADITIEQKLVTAQWNEGLGKFGDRPSQSLECSWTQSRSTPSVSHWSSTGGDFTNTAGGVTVSSTQIISSDQTFTVANLPNNTFDKSAYDLDFNVTNAVAGFASASSPINNYGFLLKVSDNLESYTSASIRLKYFSRDTNSIYPPYLELKWNDYSHTTGSLTELTDSDAVITIKNNKGEYADEGKVRFRLHARPRYPERTFTTSSAYLVNHFLPTASYWGLRDEYTEEMVVDYDTTFTKLSCDSTSNYFDFYLDGIQPERFYRLLIKTTIDGSDIVVDNDQIIKVVRNG